MSESDPYAAPDAAAPNVYNPPAEKLEAATAAPVEEAPVEVAAAPETDGGVPTGTVIEVLQWVDGDPERAARALAAEQAGQNRKSLIKSLTEG